MNTKLILIDTILAMATISLIFVQPGKISDILTGAIAALFVISFYNHVRQYIMFKKFY